VNSRQDRRIVEFAVNEEPEERVNDLRRAFGHRAVKQYSRLRIEISSDSML
jgi:hypothetical protein